MKFVKDGPDRTLTFTDGEACTIEVTVIKPGTSLYRLIIGTTDTSVYATTSYVGLTKKQAEQFMKKLQKELSK